MDLVAVAAFLVALDALAVWLLLSGAPYIPTKREGVEKMVELARVRPGARAVDIGSGDGRLVMALARAGAQAHGYEINPLLVWISRRRIRRAGLQDRATISWSNLWKADFSRFDVVTLFGVTHIMRRLERKLGRELKQGSRVVSIGFKFPTWAMAEQADGVYAYDIG